MGAQLYGSRKCESKNRAVKSSRKFDVVSPGFTIKSYLSVETFSLYILLYKMKKVISHQD